MKKLSIILAFILCLSLQAFAQDVRLKIVEQPKPELPLRYMTLDVQGAVVLRVQFLEFGEIGEITPVKSLPSGLTEKAVAAAKKIRFEPEIKDGKPITVVKEITYNYSWNGGWPLPSDNTVTSAPPVFDKAKAEEIMQKAVRLLGGDAYLQVRTQVGRGKFSTLKDNVVVAFQTFIDVITFPDRERTEFRGGGSRTVQANTGETGWIYDGEQDVIKTQNENQIANFKQGLRTSLDNLLRGYWKGEAELAYIGKRAATLGKRNDVLRLTYKDGFVVDFEFAADDGLPQKALYKRTGAEDQEILEEDHYAQFIDVGAVRTAFIIDRFTNGKPSSRINYETIEFNKPVPETIFAKPASPKDLKKDLKF